MITAISVQILDLIYNNTEIRPQMIDPQKDKNNPNQGSRIWTLWLWMFILVAMVFLGPDLMQPFKPAEITWSRFSADLLKKNYVERLEVINKEEVMVYLNEKALELTEFQKLSPGGPQFYFTIGSVESFENNISTVQAQIQDAVPVDIKYVNQKDWFLTIFSWILPFVFIVLIFYFLSRRSPGGTGGLNPFDFGKSKAAIYDTNQKMPSFDDVAGLESAKVEIREIVEFLKNPESYTALGAKIPRGIMLVGPPGTGKTLMAKAVAGEAKVPFFSLSGSEFVEMFVGVGASRVRDLFRKAKEKAPSIIFIDEIDAVGRSRGSAFSLQSNDERESTLNQLLTEMDGFGENTGVIVLAATNRPDILDKALLRPGRFDRHIYLELPSQAERIAIFKVHVRPLKLGSNINLEELAAQTPGFSGADIANICNEAALIAARKGAKEIAQQDFRDAIDRIIGGLERTGKIISEEEKKIVAYHEAGHATVSWFLEEADELMKVTIVPRGKSLGAAWYLPEEHSILTQSQLMATLCVALGGRAAEEISLGEVSSGALDDLEKVTKQAYTIVSFYGMSEHLQNLSFYDSSGRYDQSLQKPYSEATAQIIDDEVKSLVSEAYKKVKNILLQHQGELTELAQLLLEKELVLRDDLERIFGKRKKDINKDNAALAATT